ncbi:unnamed protein product, partial [Discosporangium mesarthrocarpum]
MHDAIAEGHPERPRESAPLDRACRLWHRRMSTTRQRRSPIRVFVLLGSGACLLPAVSGFCVGPSNVLKARPVDGVPSSLNTGFVCAFFTSPELSRRQLECLNLSMTEGFPSDDPSFRCRSSAPRRPVLRHLQSRGLSTVLRARRRSLVQPHSEVRHVINKLPSLFRKCKKAVARKLNPPQESSRAAAAAAAGLASAVAVVACRPRWTTAVAAATAKGAGSAAGTTLAMVGNSPGSMAGAGAG